MPLVPTTRRVTGPLLVVLVPALAFSQDDPVANFVNEAASIWTPQGEDRLGRVRAIGEEYL